MSESQRLAYDALIPDGVRALGGVYVYVQRCGLEKSLIDLIYLRASQINGCAYCIDMHTQDALKDGATVEKLMLVAAWREAGALFSEREQAGLAWAEVVTRVSRAHVPQSDFEAVRAVFSDKELADLTLAIGLINTYNRLAISFRKTPPSVAKLEAAV